ncbi:hypothetical protein DPMN_172619 [Dreissena polymorpha]|uniref:Uncharacterized protein n=1 Tax=Dreissena polymorpha TaxID=45954 RepID=A0A9D4IET2_DREPO|nr:hypothetical protein DPMN_172619 [Dreissena polymorpha]
MASICSTAPSPYLLTDLSIDTNMSFDCIKSLPFISTSKSKPQTCSSRAIRIQEYLTV